METTARRTGWIVMYVLALILALMSANYFMPGMPDAFQPEVYLDYSWVIRAHIAGGIVAILAGSLQFWSGFRDRHRPGSVGLWRRRLRPCGQRRQIPPHFSRIFHLT